METTDFTPTEEPREEARCRHYVLAHQALRSVAFGHPLAFLGILASEKARDFLSDLLDSVSRHCAEREPLPDFGVADLVVHTVRVGAFPCAVVEMPKPRAAAEAFFVAAVLLVDAEQGATEGQEVALRYFTLEKGFTFGGPPITVLCEWTADGSHLNYGPGPEPTLDSFAVAVAGLLTRE